jgi:glycosyltransferase involved in cell wall biosynthesis
MRIAIVSHSFPPARLGGAETYAESYARALAEAGHEVAVFAAEKDISRKDATIRRETRGPLEITWFVNNLFYRDFSQTFDSPAPSKPFAVWLDRFRPDLVHFQHLMDLSGRLPAVARAGRADLPTGMTLHDYWLTCPRFGHRYHPRGIICNELDFDRCAECLLLTPWRQPAGAAAVGRAIARMKNVTGVDVSAPAKAALRKIRRRKAPEAPPAGGGHFGATAKVLEERIRYFAQTVFPHIDLFHSPTRVLANELGNHGLPSARVHVAPLGLDLRLFAGLRHRPSKKIRIAFHGQLSEAKAPDLLPKAWMQVPAALQHRATLTVRGAPRDPAYFETLKDLCARAGATLEPAFSRAELPAKLSETDLLVIPSVWWENSPLTILEAFAAKTPVLAADLGGMAELVQEGRGGFRFKAGDAADLARRICRILEDPQCLHRAAQAAPPARSIADDASDLPARIVEMHRRAAKKPETLKS